MAQSASSPFLPLPRATANNRFELWKLGITHVLNAAHGGLYCQGGPDFYGSSVNYLGVPAHDLPDFDISAYFSSAADFIHRALSTPGGRTWGLISYPVLLSHEGMSIFPSNISALPSLVFKKPSGFKKSSALCSSDLSNHTASQIGKLRPRIQGHAAS